MMERTKRLLWDQRWQWWRLMNDRKTLCLANLGPFRSPRRFSARVWRASRSAQLWQQFVHPAPHLLRGRKPVRAFPGAKLSFHLIASQKQVIERNGDDLAPSLKLGRRAQSGLGPQQSLLLEAVSMLLTKAMDVAQSDFHQVGLLISNPDKPTHTRVAFAPHGVRTYHADHAHLQPPSIFQVQVVPPSDLNRPALLILDHAASRRVGVRGGIIGLQLVPVLARGSAPTCGSRSHPIKTAV